MDGSPPTKKIKLEQNENLEKIDEELYSRQIYTIGEDAMYRLVKSNVIISGLRGLGVEIAKDVILGGVKSVTLHDVSPCERADLSSQFYLSESDIGENRAEACKNRLAELNTHVMVHVSTSVLTEDLIQKHNVVVLTNSSLEEQLRVSQWTRKYKVALIIANTCGLFGQIFCDFGDTFRVLDIDGEKPASSIIQLVSQDSEGVVTCMGRHGLEDGNLVTFSEVPGMVELNNSPPTRVKVINSRSFSIGDTTKYSQYCHAGGLVTQVKVPKEMHFKTLDESLKDPGFLIIDFAKAGRAPQIHLAYMALHKFVNQYGRKPRPWNTKDAEVFVGIAETLKGDLEIDRDLLRTFSQIATGDLSPMNSFIGGVAAQEVIKACTEKFTPIHQWMYFDALECLPREISEEECASIECRYDSQIAVFGLNFQRQILSKKCLVVGAGAIGCELLKNFAMIGLGASEDGRVIVTDMDRIEKSNLNRQFLFRPGDIHHSKSTVAANAVTKMNPLMNIEPHENRVGSETEHIYNDDLFESINFVANALDNVEARKYVDERCVYYGKPLLESGTLGTKGNTQVIVPNLTETYRSSNDPPEEKYAACTVKHAPSTIEHVVQWAREDFDQLYSSNIEIALKYLEDPDYLERLEEKPLSQRLEVLKKLKETLVDDYPCCFPCCVAWARRYWEKQYNNEIRQLLKYFPPDHKTKSGERFWSAPKRCPTPLIFDPQNPLHLDYVAAAANLKAAVYGIDQCKDKSKIMSWLKHVYVPEFQPKSSRSKRGNEENSNENDTDEDDLEKVEKLLGLIPQRNDLDGLRLSVQEFEKDNSSNFHVDFIFAASNLRESNYNIPLADKLKIKQIVGKIIPAIATTTSAIAGLTCLELYKIIWNCTSLDRYKNAFVNLALPFIAFSEPGAPQKKQLNKVTWTLWDHLVCNGDMTMEEFKKQVKNQFNLSVSAILHGEKFLYSSHMGINEEHEKSSLTENIERVVEGRKITGSALLQVLCTEDVEIPNVKCIL